MVLARLGLIRHECAVSHQMSRPRYQCLLLLVGFSVLFWSTGRYFGLGRLLSKRGGHRRLHLMVMGTSRYGAGTGSRDRAIRTPAQAQPYVGSSSAIFGSG